MSKDLTGIVPIVSRPMDFNMPWHDCLMPIAPDYHAIERAVLECAYAGCKTIWIVANDDTTPLVRHRIGDYVEDPVYLRRMGKYPRQKRQQRSVFYVPVSVKHKSREWCISWTIIHGAKTAHSITSELSKWMAAENFYVSFPSSVYPPDFIREHRRDIRKEENFLFSFEEKSILKGDKLGFTFSEKQMNHALGLFQKEHGAFFDEKEDEREYYFNNFSLDKVFGQTMAKESMKIEIPWYHSLDGWESYCNYLSSEERKEIRHPGKLVISYREYSPIGRDVEKTLDEDD